MVAVCAWTSNAAGRSAHLEWNGPAECSDTAALHAAVERLLDEPLSDGDAFSAKASVVEAANGRFTLNLSIRTPEGEGTRAVEADSCKTLLNVAAFSIALALNPDLAAAPEQPGRAVAAEPDAEPSATPSGPPAAPTSTVPSAAVHDTQVPEHGKPAALWFAAHAVIDTSLLPAVAAGGEALGELVLSERVRFGLGGAAFVPQTTLSEAGGGHFSLWSLEGHVCAQAPFGVELGLCPTFHLAHVHGEGRGVAPRLSQSSWVPAPGIVLLALAEWSPHLAASLRATGLFPLNRDTFVIHAGPVHKIPAFSGELALGVAVRAF
jgi:hypothetical protein